jgi:cell wall-associated NlpC family hydrolase
MRFGSCLTLVVVLLLSFPTAASASPARSSSRALALAPPAEALREKEPRVVRIAFRYLGTPYRWAGASPSGFDCSGFVMYVYGRVGVRLPHNSAQLWGEGRYVSRRHLQPGDVVFFAGLSHVGIYIGNGQMVEAPFTGARVRISSAFRPDYAGATRPAGLR